MAQIVTIQQRKKGGTMEKKHWGFAAAWMAWAFLMITPAAIGQEKGKSEGAPKEGMNLTVTRMAVGTGVENREPQGVGEKFPAATEKVYCFVEVTNIPKDLELTLMWFAGDKAAGEIALAVKQGAKWRTWAYKNLRGLKGDWKVEVKTPEGKILKEVRFKVE
jgi:hypothetical protein